jgi:signal transduction histidine kinase/ligand-binding sensor domain-containing protein/DNA-binding response OmpR family regulator
MKFRGIYLILLTEHIPKKKVGYKAVKKGTNLCFPSHFLFHLHRILLSSLFLIMKKLILLILILLTPVSVLLAHGYMFKHLEVRDGLPNNQINAIFKDSEGFMWFGTASGLVRYDGYCFKIFRNYEADKTSLPDNYIENIFEDGDGRLWVCTGQSVYTLYDRFTGTFVQNIRQWMWNVGIDGTPRRVFVDKQKTLWFAVDGKGLYYYPKGAKLAKEVSLGAKNDFVGSITDIKECKDGIVFVYDNGRVICIDRKQHDLRWMLDDVVKELNNSRVDVFSLFVDAGENLWIYGAPGIWTYNLVRKEWQSQYYKEFNQSHNMIRSMAQDKQGRIWFGKDQDGIDIWNMRTGEKISLVYHADDERGLPNNTVNVLYEDCDGIMWVGTYKKGVAYYHESIYKFALNHLGDVNCIEEDQNENLWLGTNDAGLIHWNPNTNEQKTYKCSDVNTVSSNVIVCLLRARNNKLWIGTFWEGLNCFDGKRFLHYKNIPGNTNSLSNNNVWSLAEDKDGNIWIGTLGGGLQCLNPMTGQFTTYNMTNSNIISNHIASICMTRDNRLIIGTSSSGLSILDLTTRKFTNLVGNLAGTVRFSNQSINQVFEDSRGLIWIGTRDGLNLYDPRRDLLQIVSVGGDNSKQFIAGITEDENKNLWVTTANGIMNIVPSIDTKDGTYNLRVYTYDDKDGLQSCEFNQRSVKRLTSGEIVIGGLYGINSFFPDNIKYNKTLPKVIFTGFQLFNTDVEIGKSYGGRVLLKKALNEAREITLDYKQNVFTVLFASDNYILPDKTQYVYKLEGFNEDWMKGSADVHRVTYTNLAPGTYVLKVRAVNSDSYTGTKESTLKIIILPPFWMTPWAYIVYALLLLGILVIARNEILRRERNKFRIHQMEQEVQKNEEISQMKFRFFTNVSHELRTPLTLIISPLETMMKETIDRGHLDQIKMMHRNALRLLNLVNQLLDFRKSEVTGLKLNLSEGEIVEFIHTICNSFLMLSEKKNVHLTFFSAVDSLNMLFDEDKIGKVVMNLLSNAFKFTPEGGRVDVALELIQGTGDVLEIKISDTGIGISDEDKARVFERFYQVKSKGDDGGVTGSGIGLSLVRDFITLHGGEVRVFDNIGSGSVFVVDIPVKQILTSDVGEKAAEHTEPLVPVTTEHEVVNETTHSAQSLTEEQNPVEGQSAANNQSVADGQPQGVDREKGEDRKPVVLIVDDNEDFIAFMRYTLSIYFQVESASNGREAWQIIPELMPDIIVSDVMMPEMDGNELCRWVKTEKRTSNIPLILLTAKQSVENKVEGLTIGADDYITKPFNMEVLVLRMRKLIALSKKDKTRTHIEPEPSQIAITSLDEKLVEKAIQYVENNMARTDLSVEELSHELGMSRVHLYKKLLQITGKTPIEFIRIIRLKRAAQLLRESQQNVSEIAYEVGFNNPKYFSKYFKEEFGVLPSVYQEREGK